MATDILAFWVPGPIELIFILIVTLIFFGIPFFLIVWLVRCFLQNKRENIKLRLEVAKLADELEQIRKQNDNDKNNSSPESC